MFCSNKCHVTQILVCVISIARKLFTVNTTERNLWVEVYYGSQEGAVIEGWVGPTIVGDNDTHCLNQYYLDECYALG